MTSLTTMIPMSLAAGPWGHDGGPPVLFLLMPLLVLLVVLGTAIALTVSPRGREREQARRAGEAVLAQRYAEGTIDVEEYEARLAVLREKR